MLKIMAISGLGAQKKPERELNKSKPIVPFFENSHASTPFRNLWTAFCIL